jgi:hypothetical protein
MGKEAQPLAAMDADVIDLDGSTKTTTTLTSTTSWTRRLWM